MNCAIPEGDDKEDMEPDIFLEHMAPKLVRWGLTGRVASAVSSYHKDVYQLRTGKKFPETQPWEEAGQLGVRKAHN